MTTLETPPPFTGHFDPTGNRMWIDYTEDMFDYIERNQHIGKCEAWYYDEDEQLKRIDPNLFGKTIDGEEYEMPMPVYLSITFASKSDPLLMIFKMMLGAPPDPLH